MMHARIVREGGKMKTKRKAPRQVRRIIPFWAQEHEFSYACMRNHCRMCQEKFLDIYAASNPVAALTTHPTRAV